MEETPSEQVPGDASIGWLSVGVEGDGAIGVTGEDGEAASHGEIRV